MSNGATGADSADAQRSTGAPAVALADVTSPSGWPTAAATRRSQRASLDVADGEFVAIVGPTGCGKSTLLNVTAGLFPPSRAGVEIFGSGSAGPQPPGRLPVPVRCAVSLEDRAGECRHRPRDRRHAARRGARRARRNGSRASALARSGRAIRTCCPAASGSAWVSRRC